MIYPARYLKEPRKRKYYTIACDLIAIYGLGRKWWKTPELSEDEAREVWKLAKKDMRF